MEGYKIRQIMPLPENMTVLRDWQDEDGKEMTRDVDFDDFAYCLALVTRPDGYDDVVPYSINDAGLEPDYEVVPVRTCPCCGKRMSAYRPIRRSLYLHYYCRNCGKDLSSDYWDYLLPCEAGFGGTDTEGKKYERRSKATVFNYTLGKQFLAQGKENTPKGCYCIATKTGWIGIDNLTGDYWMEEFKTREECLDWLDRKCEVGDKEAAE